ncbi:MAG: HAD-IG family 5'-nucleotidase [Polyangiaceae bacterium]|nr:HAD-IG family 5'-nucleotidase [Polyangiaceae bacterium]
MPQSRAPRSLALLPTDLPPLARRVFTNRTLNFNSIQVVGYDMDYTLVHYDSGRWEARAYESVKQTLAERGWPVAELHFEPQRVSLGLVLDRELGNLVKANRFGHVRGACHGTRMLGFEEWRAVYGTAPVDLRAPRWEFMNTLFALSESCLYIQLVDLLDQGRLEPGLGYGHLYREVRQTMAATHVEGKLKGEIMAAPSDYVVLDEQLPRTLLDQKAAGKKLLLITNSEWPYANRIMSHAFDRFLPSGSWRTLFDLVIVQAAKPDFFSGSAPCFRLADERLDYYCPYTHQLEQGAIYLGGHARLVETSLGVEPDHVLYIGDHIFADVHVSKDLLRWRTGLVVRELEHELGALLDFGADQVELDARMADKALLEHQFAWLRTELLRAAERGRAGSEREELERRLRAVRSRLIELDQRVAPLAKQSNELANPVWGPLMRCGNDKSHLARQIERYADIYMSRVSNLLPYTPFAYLRAPRVTLPHDAALG